MREAVKKLHQWWNSIGRVSPWVFGQNARYFVSLTGASLTFSDVVTSDERERQSWTVLTTQSEGMLKIEDPALDQAMYVLESWL